MKRTSNRSRVSGEGGCDVPIKRVVAVAKQDAELIADRVGSDASMLSAAEVSVVYSLLRVAAPKTARVAELGT